MCMTSLCASFLLPSPLSPFMRRRCVVALSALPVLTLSCVPFLRRRACAGCVSCDRLLRGPGERRKPQNMRFDGVCCAPPGPSLRGELTRPSASTERSQRRQSVSVTRPDTNSPVQRSACTAPATALYHTRAHFFFVFHLYFSRRRPVAHMHTRAHTKCGSVKCACLCVCVLLDLVILFLFGPSRVLCVCVSLEEE